MKKVLLPLTFEKSGELIKLLDTTIKLNQEIYKHEIEELRAKGQVKDNLVDHFIIANLNGITCYPAVDEKLPEWLRMFLFDCYYVCHNHLANNLNNKKEK